MSSEPKYSAFNIYKIHKTKDKANSGFRLEGLNLKSQKWETIRPKDKEYGYDSIDEIVDKIYETNEGKLESTLLHYNDPQNHQIPKKGAAILGKGLGIETIIDIENNEKIIIAMSLQRKIDRKS